LTASLNSQRVEYATAGGAATSQSVPDGGGAAADAGTASDGEWIRNPGVQGEVRTWAFATVLFALAWFLTLAWGLHRHAPVPAAGETPEARRPRPPRDHRALRRALDVGDL